MSEVSRYEPVHEDAIAADADGRYVRYADYEAMRERAEQAERDREVLGRAVRYLATVAPGLVFPAYGDGVADALARCTPASREGA